MVSGVILAGGGSRRMGQDKALLKHGRISLLERVRDSLLPHCEEILVVAPEEKLEAYRAAEKVQLVADASRNRGPLVGLRAGIAAANGPFIFAVGCDMPLLQAAAVSLVLQADPGFDVVVPRIAGHLEPLHARYSRRCLAAIDGILEDGVKAIESFYPQVSVQEITEREMCRVDPQLISLTNINTRQQWAAFIDRGGE